MKFIRKGTIEKIAVRIVFTAFLTLAFPLFKSKAQFSELPDVPIMDINHNETTLHTLLSQSDLSLLVLNANYDSGKGLCIEAIKTVEENKSLWRNEFDVEANVLFLVYSRTTKSDYMKLAEAYMTNNSLKASPYFVEDGTVPDQYFKQCPVTTIVNKTGQVLFEQEGRLVPEVLEEIKFQLTKLNTFQKEVNGSFIYRYGNGNIRASGHFLEGKPNGLWIEYHKNGQIHKTGTYVNGRYDGNWKYFFDSGNLYADLNYKDTKLMGISRIYYESGSLKAEVIYKDGEEVSKVEYLESGEVKK